MHQTREQRKLGRQLAPFYMADGKDCSSSFKYNKKKVGIHQS